MSTPRRCWLSVVALLLVLASVGLVVLRAQLPRLLLDRFHRSTARMGENWYGLAGGVDVDVFARHYRLRDVRVLKRGDAHDVVPLVRAARIDVYLQPLARRSRVVVEGVRIALESRGRLGEGVAWRRYLEALAPGTEVIGVEFRDVGFSFHREAEPALVVTVDNLHGSLVALDTSQARLEAAGLLMAHAPLRIEASFDPQGPMQSLRLRARAHDVELPKLNAFARRWARIDFNRGEGEMALAIDFMAPILTGSAVVSLADVDVFDSRQDLRGGHLLSAAREVLAGAWMAAMEDPTSRRIERQFAIDARLQPPDDNFEGLRSVLQQAFASLGRHGLQ